MDSFPNPYAALIATFNQVSPLESKDDLDDPQHLPDDDLLLWANAQFTYDIPPGVGIYEDDMGVKLAMSQQQFQQTQQQQLQQLQLQQQQQHQPQQPHQPKPTSLAASQAAQHQPQYQPSDMQQQLQQFDVMHRYLDAGSEDPRTSLSVVERSRQRNPVSGAGIASPSLASAQYDLRTNSIYAHGQAEPTTFSTPATAGPISAAAARLLRQPILALQRNQHQQPYALETSPLSSPTTMSDFRELQINAPPSITSPEPIDDTQRKRGINRKENMTSASSAVASISTTLSLGEERQSPLDFEDDLDSDQDEEDHHGSSASSNSSRALRPAQGLISDDTDHTTKLAAEEDKRRRNTAASARFRHKKRLREQILEKTAKEMTAKSEILELRVRELEMEIKWLRGLIVEKDSRMLDVGSSSSSSSSGSFARTAPTSTLSTATSLAFSSSLPAVSTLTSANVGSKSEGGAGVASASKKRSKKAKAQNNE